MPQIKIGDTWTEAIKCPECGYIQEARVIQHWPWPVYIHDCFQCGYTIMESEWERIKDEN